MFKLTTPDVAHDLAGGSAAHRLRLHCRGAASPPRAGHRPFTVMSCDNLRHNGDTARKAVVSLRRARDPELAAWIDAKSSFPIPWSIASPRRFRRRHATGSNARSGIDDAVPALGETFIQWVIEDEFSAGRPPLETVGVEIRDDVVAFEFMKGRMLNASHILLGLSGICHRPAYRPRGAWPTSACADCSTTSSIGTQFRASTARGRFTADLQGCGA